MYRTNLSRATATAPYHRHIKRVGLALLFSFMALWPSLAWADIEVKPQYEDHEPIVATVTITEVPEGAKLRGSIQIEGASYIPAGDNVYHIWAAPGKYTIRAQGVWVLTKEVTVGDQTFPVLLDFGQYAYQRTFVVGEGDEPVPPQPPPPPPGERTAVILEETEQKTPAQAILWQQIQKEFQPQRFLILDDDQPSAAKYLSQAGSVRPVLLVFQAGQFLRAVPVPSSVEAVKQEVAR